MTIDAMKQGGTQSSTYGELEEHAEISGVGGKKVFVVGSDGNQISFPSLVKELYDNITQTQATLTDTWVYKLGATTVATVVITYVDATKAVISTVVKT